MKVSELIQELQNYPMDTNVVGLCESRDWQWNGEYSEEVTTVYEGSITDVEPWTNEYGDNVVRIS